MKINRKEILSFNLKLNGKKLNKLLIITFVVLNLKNPLIGSREPRWLLHLIKGMEVFFSVIKIRMEKLNLTL